MSYTVTNPKALAKGTFIIEHRPSRFYLGQRASSHESQCITDHYEDILFVPEDDEDVEPEDNVDTTKYRIGHIKYSIFQKARMTASGIPFGDTCDEHRSDMKRAAFALFDEDGEVQVPTLEDWFDKNIMWVEEMRLEPKWRGYGIGLLALDSAINRHFGFEQNAVLINPAGLVSDTANSVAARKRAQQKLCAYFSLMGLRQISPSAEQDFVVYGLRSYPRPTIEGVVPHLFRY